MGYYYGYGYGIDGYYILIIIAGIIALWASSHVKSVFGRYSRVRSYSGMTGAEVANRMLHDAGIYDVSVRQISGSLTDHYDPRNKVLSLSQSVYGSYSVAAIAVAAHECGHAIQHSQQYLPLSLRSAIVPIANIGSTAAWPLIFIGLLFNGSMSNLFIEIGILLFSGAVAFQLITLPVEFNASGRALRILEGSGFLTEDEMPGAKKVLTAAALTYVASAATAVLQLLRLIAIFGGRRRD